MAWRPQALTHGTMRCCIRTPSAYELATLHAHRRCRVVSDEQMPVTVVLSSQACDCQRWHAGWTPLGYELELEGSVVTPAAKRSSRACGASVDMTAHLDCWALHVQCCYYQRIRHVQCVEHGEAQAVRWRCHHVAAVMDIGGLAAGWIH